MAERKLIAMRPLTVEGPRRVMTGDYVPELTSSPKLQSLINAKHVCWEDQKPAWLDNARPTVDPKKVLEAENAKKAASPSNDAEPEGDSEDKPKSKGRGKGKSAGK